MSDTKYNPDDKGKSFNEETDPQWTWYDDAKESEERERLREQIRKTKKDLGV